MIGSHHHACNFQRSMGPKVTPPTYLVAQRSLVLLATQPLNLKWLTKKTNGQVYSICIQCDCSFNARAFLQPRYRTLKVVQVAENITSCYRCVWAAGTVKPVQNGHPFVQTKAVLVDRCSLFAVSIHWINAHWLKMKEVTEKKKITKIISAVQDLSSVSSCFLFLFFLVIPRVRN